MNIFGKHLAQIEEAIPEMITEMAAEAIEHFDDSFSNKGFTDGGLKKWKPVFNKDGSVKEKPLVKTGNLRGSIKSEERDDSATIYSDVEYAEYHNEGGDVDGRPPQRQFMGASQELDDKSIDIIKDKLNRILK